MGYPPEISTASAAKKETPTSRRQLIHIDPDNNNADTGTSTTPSDHELSRSSAVQPDEPSVALHTPQPQQ